mmetsp:Transcript_7407/g.30836  ORF Transcript_7407/g.30836 Transcript_7407/m.30836 type:complete len:205 (-) Transcript_7407:82-696(-)
MQSHVVRAGSPVSRGFPRASGSREEREHAPQREVRHGRHAHEREHHQAQSRAQLVRFFPELRHRARRRRADVVAAHRGGVVHLLQHRRAHLVGDGVHQGALVRRAHLGRAGYTNVSILQRRRDGAPARVAHVFGVALQARQNRAGRREVVRLLRRAAQALGGVVARGGCRSADAERLKRADNAAAHGAGALRRFDGVRLGDQTR